MTVDGSGDEEIQPQGPKDDAFFKVELVLLAILPSCFNAKLEAIFSFLVFFRPYVKNLHPDCGI